MAHFCKFKSVHLICIFAHCLLIGHFIAFFTAFHLPLTPMTPGFCAAIFASGPVTAEISENWFRRRQQETDITVGHQN